MVKKFLKTFLIIGFFGIFLLWGNSSSAVLAPTNPTPKTELPLDKNNGLKEVTYDYIAIEFSWAKNADLNVEWYHLVYRCAENCSGGNATWVIQPTDSCPSSADYSCIERKNCAGPSLSCHDVYSCPEENSCCCNSAGEPLPEERVSKLVTGGFEFSSPTKATKYKWQVGACSSQAEGACVYSQPQEFTTPLQPPPPSPPPPPPGGNNDENGGGFLNPLKCQDLQCAINALINFLFILCMALGPLLIIYAAFLILTAAGNAEQVNKAKTIILWTLVALAIVLLAKGLPAVIKGAVGG